MCCSRPTPGRAPSPGACMPRSASCRSSARTGIPTRPGSRATRRSPIPRRCWWCPTIMSPACSTARVFRWKRSACPVATAVRPSRIRARSGACLRRIGRCSARRRRGSGSSIRSPPCSTSTRRSAPPTRMPSMTGSPSAWRSRPIARARCSSASTSRCWRPPMPHWIRSRSTRRCATAAGAAG